MTRLFVLLLAVLLGLTGLTACTDVQHDSIRFGMSRLPVTLDPRLATDAASSRINRLLYRQLVDFDMGYLPVESLAKWQQLTARHYRFSLKSNGRVFSNGQTLTADDIKATYAFILDPANASPHRVSLSHIQNIEVIDQDTIDFHLSKTDALFPGRLVIGIVPAELDPLRPLNRHPVGSGPFLIDGWNENVLRLQRKADQQFIEFVGVADPTVRVLKLLRGEIDLLQNDLPPELLAYLDDESDIDVQHGPGSNFAYLGFNLQDEVLQHQAIRKAIAHAINRQAIITHILDDAARPANTILTPDHWAGNAQLKAYAYDPDKARQILQSAGYSDERPLQLVYKTSSDPFRLRLATIIQQQLKDVGIDVELRSYDWGTFYGDIKNGRFQMYSLMWVGVKLPDIFRYVFHSEAIPPAGANRGRLINARIDSLIDRADAMTDLTSQAQAYSELQALLHEQLPYVPLWYEDHVVAMRADIENYTLASDGNYDGLKSVRRAKD